MNWKFWTWGRRPPTPPAPTPMRRVSFRAEFRPEDGNIAVYTDWPDCENTEAKYVEATRLVNMLIMLTTGQLNQAIINSISMNGSFRGDLPTANMAASLFARVAAAEVVEASGDEPPFISPMEALGATNKRSE